MEKKNSGVVSGCLLGNRPNIVGADGWKLKDPGLLGDGVWVEGDWRRRVMFVVGSLTWLLWFHGSRLL